GGERQARPEPGECGRHRASHGTGGCRRTSEGEGFRISRPAGSLHAGRVGNAADVEIITAVARVVADDVAGDHSRPVEYGAQDLAGRPLLAEESVTRVAELGELPARERDAADRSVAEVGRVRLGCDAWARGQLAGEHAAEPIRVCGRGGSGGKGDEWGGGRGACAHGESPPGAAW